MRAAGLPDGGVQGAVFCCNNSEYNAQLSNYTAHYAASGVAGSISYHHYAVGGCSGKAATMEQLLADGASAGGAAYLAPFAAACAQAAIPFVVGEANSVSCGGRRNISDAFGSALWAWDAMLNLAAVGAARVNFHGGTHEAYTPVGWPGLPQSRVPDVRPLYYAALAMAEASANSSALVAADVQSSNALIKAHALRDARGVWRVVVVHKDPAAEAAAAVTVTPAGGGGGGGGGASLARLRAAGGVTGRYAVTWRGQTFDTSQDGLPLGEPTAEAVPLRGGSYSFSLPPAEAAMLTFS